MEDNLAKHRNEKFSAMTLALEDALREIERKNLDPSPAALMRLAKCSRGTLYTKKRRWTLKKLDSIAEARAVRLAEESPESKVSGIEFHKQRNRKLVRWMKLIMSRQISLVLELEESRALLRRRNDELDGESKKLAAANEEIEKLRFWMVKRGEVVDITSKINERKK